MKLRSHLLLLTLGTILPLLVFAFIALGDVPTAPMPTGLGTPAITMTAGFIVALIAALILAAALGQRIARPISALAAAARALAAGKRPELPDGGGVDELREVSQALADAATAVRAREDALRAADRTKDEFLAMLSHELRNPLGALAAAAEVLNHVPSKEATEVVVRQVGHMSRLIEDLLDVSRVTRGKISLSRRPLDIAAAAVKVEKEWRVSGRLAHHSVAIEAPARVWVQADEARVEQIVSNLLGNAVKYTPSGGHITVSVKRGRNHALLQVRDTGVGMTPELAARVFDLFVQGERTLDRGAGGLGIGLTLVKRLAELHGGTAFAASAGPGRGSQFTVVLPAIEEPSQTLPEAARDRPKQRHSILLIEDSDDARRSLAAALKLDGHEVYAAADGKAGLAAVAVTKPEVAVIDIGLPGMDGYQVAQTIRDMPSNESMVLIALTGYGQPEAVRRAREAGFDEHVLKPIAPEQLMRLIDVACAAKARRAGGRPSA